MQNIDFLLRVCNILKHVIVILLLPNVKESTCVQACRFAWNTPLHPALRAVPVFFREDEALVAPGHLCLPLPGCPLSLHINLHSVVLTKLWAPDATFLSFFWSVPFHINCWCTGRLLLVEWIDEQRLKWFLSSLTRTVSVQPDLLSKTYSVHDTCLQNALRQVCTGPTLNPSPRMLCSPDAVPTVPFRLCVPTLRSRSLSSNHSKRLPLGEYPRLPVSLWTFLFCCWSIYSLRHHTGAASFPWSTRKEHRLWILNPILALPLLLIPSLGKSPLRPH